MERIIKVFARNPQGLTITQAARLLGCEYETVRRRVVILKGRGTLMEAKRPMSYRQVGPGRMAKLYRLKRDT